MSAQHSSSASASNSPVRSLADAGAPLVDQRSLWGSVVIHGLFLLLIVAIPTPQVSSTLMSKPGAMAGELAEIDNRITPTEKPGGAPDDLGGSDEIPVDVRGPGGPSDQAQALNSLLKDIAPSAADASDAINAAIPLPSSSGLGMIPGTGLGGGGGLGGGSGGGSGRGMGPGTEFFGAKETGSSFVYVIDCSGSMAHNQALTVAKAEFGSSLGRLPIEARFGAVFYNLHNRIYSENLVFSSNAEKRKVKRFLQEIGPFGGTDHMAALRRGLAMKPEVVFFLTDADLMTDSEVEEILKEVGPTRIHAVQFGVGPDISSVNPLKKLTLATNGSYRYIDTNTFTRGSR